MSWKSFIARRYLRGTRTSSGLSAQSLIGVAGVALGVAALLIVQAVMAGFTAKLKEQMLGATAHVLIIFSGGDADLEGSEIDELLETVKQVEGVTGLTPFYRKEAMLARGEQVGTVRLFGVEPESAGNATIFPEKMIEGSFSNLKPDSAEEVEPNERAELLRSEEPRIILGADLASGLGVGVGGRVRLICPLCGIGPMGPVPTVKTFIVGGIFEVGNLEYDGQFGFVKLDVARRFFHPEGGNQLSGIQVAVENIDEADAVAARVDHALGTTPAWVSHWKNLLGPLFDALQLEKLALFIVILMIVLVAAFNIAGMEILFVREKIHDIAILKAMGAPGAGITHVFLAKGAAIGFFGTTLGLGLGLGLCWLQSEFHLIQIDASVYNMRYMPVLVLPLDVVKVLLAPTVITTVAAWLPARRAGKLAPTEALRSD